MTCWLQVREMWKVLEKFHEDSRYQREVVDSVVQDRVNMYTVRAKDIAFQVSGEVRIGLFTCDRLLSPSLQIPEMVLQEFQSLSREGRASTTNTYHAGKLNLQWSVYVHVCVCRHVCA